MIRAVGADGAVSSDRLTGAGSSTQAILRMLQGQGSLLFLQALSSLYARFLAVLRLKHGTTVLCNNGNQNFEAQRTCTTVPRRN